MARCSISARAADSCRSIPRSCISGWPARPSAHVKITWPSGAMQEVSGLEPGYVYTIVEGSQRACAHAVSSAEALARVRAARQERSRVWRHLAARTGAHARSPTPGDRDSWCCTPASVRNACRRARRADRSEGREGRSGRGVFACSGATFSNTAQIFRCRWFCWWMAKAGLARSTRTSPRRRRCARDLAQIEQSHALALPFPGKYYLNPRRNYFKLGAAFYWAGYPDRALPYLAETLRTRPDNWKALQAMARIQLELGRNQDALTSFQQVIAMQERLSAGVCGRGRGLRQAGRHGERAAHVPSAPWISTRSAPMP